MREKNRLMWESSFHTYQNDVIIYNNSVVCMTEWLRRGRRSGIPKMSKRNLHEETRNECLRFLINSAQGMINIEYLAVVFVCDTAAAGARAGKVQGWGNEWRGTRNAT